MVSTLIRPLSLYQIHLQPGLLQVEFSPLENSILALYSNSEIKRYSLDGKKTWDLSFSFKPIVFKINETGDLLAILGEGKLAFFNFTTNKLSSVKVNPQFNLLEFHKNLAALSGFLPSISFFNSSGKKVKSLKYDFLVRKFTTAHSGDKLIIYNNELKLVCSGLEGDVAWETKYLKIDSDLKAADKGNMIYFQVEAMSLVRFDIKKERSIILLGEHPIKLFSPSSRGNYILILDSRNRLGLYNRERKKVWEDNFPLAIENIKISSKGHYFLTVDSKRILSCFSFNFSGKERADFLEIKEHLRIPEKTATWSKKFPKQQSYVKLKQLTVNSNGSKIGMVGLDGKVLFLDQRGNLCFEKSFPARKEKIGLNDSGSLGYVYGQKQIMIFDFISKESSYIIFDKSFWGEPVINFHQKKIYLISKGKELSVYDFEGHAIKSFPLKDEFRSGLSCESNGIVLLYETKIAGFTESGKKNFSFSIEKPVCDFLYRSNQLYISTKGPSLLSFNLSSLEGKKKKFNSSNKKIKIISCNPLLISDGNKNLFHLDKNLSIVSTFTIKSEKSHMFFDDGAFFEIPKQSKGFYCSDQNEKTLWQYNSIEEIEESVLTENGLVFFSEDEVRFIALKNIEDSEKHFSQFLEIT